jgi:hypothetical protein
VCQQRVNAALCRVRTGSFAPLTVVRKASSTMAHPSEAIDSGTGT